MTEEQARAIVEEAAIQMWQLELGLSVDWDTLLDALQTAGYDEQRCADLWWNRYMRDPDDQA